jgi:hypothetical protein
MDGIFLDHFQSPTMEFIKAHFLTHALPGDLKILTKGTFQ